jgi:hypothetical protein
MMTKIGIYSHKTGEQIEREMTAEELAQREAEVSVWQEKQNLKAQAEAEAQAARSAVLTKLGLTAEEAQALLG